MIKDFISTYAELVATIIGAVFTAIGTTIAYTLKQLLSRLNTMEERITKLEKIPASIDHIDERVVAVETNLQELETETTEIKVNYLDRFRDLEIKLLKDNSHTRHFLNDNFQKIMEMINFEKDKNFEKFVTQEFCSSHHKQSEIEIANIKNDIKEIKIYISKLVDKIVK